MLNTTHRIVLTAFAGVVLILLSLTRCGGERTGRQTEQAAAPSRHVETRTEADGSQTATYTVLLAEKDAAIARLRADSSRLKRLLADELQRVKRPQAATVFVTATPCGDTLEQGVTVREERAPGLLGFLQPRQVLVDVRQLTPGARTLDVQSFALPPSRPRRFGVGLFAGYGVGPDFQPAPMIGVGISYNLIRF